MRRTKEGKLLQESRGQAARVNINRLTYKRLYHYGFGKARIPYLWILKLLAHYGYRGGPQDGNNDRVTLRGLFGPRDEDLPPMVGGEDVVLV